MQKKVVENAEKYGARFNVRIDQEFALLKLMEEVGEFAEAVLTHDKKSRPDKFVSSTLSKQRIGEELADIVGMAIVNANIFQIDLEEALSAKWIKKNDEQPN